MHANLFNQNASKKDIFLHNLRSNNGRYKRYIKAPLRYGGGKSLAVGLIVECIPNGVRRVISPFIGGGSVEIACTAELGLEVLGFDIFDILVNFYQVLLKDKQALYNSLLSLEPNQETYNIVKQELKAHYKKECVKNSPHLANKERLCQKEAHEKFHDPYSRSKELSVQLTISFCIKEIDPKLEKAALMNGVFISPYKKSTHCQRTHLDNKSLKEIALDMNPKLKKQSPFIRVAPNRKPKSITTKSALTNSYKITKKI